MCGSRDNKETEAQSLQNKTMFSIVFSIVCKLYLALYVSCI